MSTTTTTAGVDGAVHVLVYPFPAPGHIIPLLDLTHLLLTRGLTVTVLVTPTHLPLLDPLLSTHPSSSIQPLVLQHPDSPTSSQCRLAAKIRATSDFYNPILQWFQSHPSPPVAIISDFFLGWTHNLASQIGVPRVVFWPYSAFGTSVFSCLWRDLPKNDEPDNENFLISFPDVPNSPSYPWWQLSHSYRNYKAGDPDWEFLRNSMLANLRSWGVVFNSFTELERVYIDHVKKEAGHNRVWAVGPLLPPVDEDDLMGPTKRGGSSAVPPHEVMTWLDGKADDSVVYVCFGSRGVLTNKQMVSLAAAIECGGVHFIWCVKATDQGHADGNAGARHRAVGAFVTHCGWNSVLEGVAAGVMMVTWPLSSDQFSNASLLVDQVGLAVRACEGGDQSVPDSAELSRLLAESVSGTRPERAQVMRLRDAALNGVKGGSSGRDLEEFVKRLGELKSKKSCD
uniref:Putative UDP-glycosyltransferase 89B1-like n=1 Tax=Davidia involucrata TaxID=16924 RepID=A0A5B7A3F2_DAVIN